MKFTPNLLFVYFTPKRGNYKFYFKTCTFCNQFNNIKICNNCIVTHTNWSKLPQDIKILKKGTLLIKEL